MIAEILAGFCIAMFCVLALVIVPFFLLAITSEFAPALIALLAGVMVVTGIGAQLCKR